MWIAPLFLLGCAVQPVDSDRASPEPVVLADPPVNQDPDVEDPDADRATGSAGVPEAPREPISATIKKYAGQLKYCYEEQRKHTPDLAGRLELAFSLADGAAYDVSVVKNTTGSAELEECIQQHLVRWRFPPDVNGRISSWPFVFTH